MSDSVEEFRALLQRAREGCEQAARQFHEQYGQPILRVVRRWLRKQVRTKVDSTDLTQEVWKDFFRGTLQQKQFDGPQHLLAFLTSMARNKVREAQRRYTQAGRDVAREEPLQAGLAHLEQSFRTLPAVEEELAARDEWDRWMAVLPALHHSILQGLRSGRTQDEMAAAFGLSRKSVQRLVQATLRSAASHGLSLSSLSRSRIRENQRRVM
ncbi:MAG: sigma-70 family RNA polymerase sigma factor [Gemmataceae bacterium]|nr:sigma-70 family RNA polymerase sigma factor [Gemmataceae bacterium]